MLCFLAKYLNIKRFRGRIRRPAALTWRSAVPVDMHTAKRGMDVLDEPIACPYMTCNVSEDGEPMYCVYGLGEVFCHSQRWQAEWKLLCMCKATVCGSCTVRD